MPRLWIPSYSDLKGYTFPIVTQIIDSSPRVPNGLVDIPEPHQAALIASLAVELAIVSKSVLIASRPDRIERETDEEALQACGNYSYLKLLQAIRDTRERISTVEQRLLDLDRFASDYYTLNTEHPKRSKLGKGVHGEPIFWRYDLYPSEAIDDLRLEFGKANRIKSRALDSLLRLDAQRKPIESQIRESVRFKSQIAHVPSTVRLDWSKAAMMQADGAAYLLRNNDPEWWTSFITRFRRVVETNANGSVIALRDPSVLRRLSSMVPPNGRWSDTVVTFFKKYGSPWGNGVRSLRRYNGIRFEMRKEDAAALSWLREHGRSANFYTRWLSTLETSSVEQYWGPNAELDEVWLSRMKKQYIRGHVREDGELRCNELSWCLSRRGPYKFQLMRGKEGAEAWEQHLKHWWGPIAKRLRRVYQ